MKKRYQFSAVIIILCLFLTTGYSQVLETNSISNTDRKYEPVELKMEKRYFEPLFQTGIATSQLFLYAYHSGKWDPIPFQIDEQDPFNPSNNIIDSTDVLLFLTKDLGDKVTLGNWIANAESQSNKRYEIEVVDPRDQTKKGWCYLFVSATLTEQDKSPVKYLTADLITDKVISNYYQLDYGRKWYPKNIAITTDGGGNNKDFYDRTKIRFIMLIGGLWMNLSEDSLVTPPDKMIEYSSNSVIRLKRKIPLQVSLIGTPVKFSMTYYPFSTQFSGEIGLDQYVGLARVKAVRMSFDLDPNAVSMKFFSGDSIGIKNKNILIDGANYLDNVDTTLVKNQKNWTMVSGTPGTMLTINNVRYKSNPPKVTPEPYVQYLYYWDDKTGSILPGKTYPPEYNWDSGDSASYGDHGMVFESYSLTDSLHYVSATYFLGSNKTAETAQTMFQNVFAPLLSYVGSQNYVTNVEWADKNQLPSAYCLRPNFPNPFNPTTNILFDLPTDDFVVLKIFDLQGKHIITLVNQKLNAGVHHYVWDGRDENHNLVNSGIYICSLKTATFHDSQKMVVVK